MSTLMVVTDSPDVAQRQKYAALWREYQRSRAQLEAQANLHARELTRHGLFWFVLGVLVGGVALAVVSAVAR